MAEIPVDLREALAAMLANQPGDALRQSVARMIEAYRSERVPASPIMASPTDVAAYAAYRMPATFAAVRRVLASVALAAPSFAPETQLDLGGGTGSAAWAAVDVFDSLVDVTVVDQVGGALTFGAELARGAASPVVRTATWQTERLDAGPTLPPADLVTLSYVLAELSPAAQAAVVDLALAAGRTVVVVEPGTPAGYRRVLAARERLIAAGRPILAPCPHAGTCPLVGSDWCHFGARINRSALHRRVKEADLPYEDEKFAYVAAGSGGTGGWSRVLTRPAHRKGMVTLRLCAPDGTAKDRIVSKRHGDLYKSARDTEWGDTFPNIS